MARSTPSRSASRSKIALLTLCIASSFGLAPAAATADGAALYQDNCAKCHGDDGKAQTPVGKAMKVPALSAGLMVDAVTAAVRGNAKHKSIASKVSDEDLAAIAAHIQTLGSAGSSE